MLNTLSPSEEILLRFLKNGYSNQQASRRLLVPVAQIKQQVQTILHKLNLKNRIQTIIYTDLQ